MTLQQLRAWAAGQLAGEPFLAERAGRDADLLLMFGLGVGRGVLFAHPERVLTADEVGRVEGLVERRLRMEPVQYITGEQEFYGLPFRVTRETLIPRPETELLVDAVLARVSGTVEIVDVGTGSGAIAVALASRLPEARVLGVDLSDGALGVARENAVANGVGVEFLRSDLLAGVAGSFDVIVSNPPYVPEGDRGGLHPEVREFEPRTALFAGADGLEVYRRLVPEAWKRLRVGGWLAMEFGFGQGVAMRELMEGWGEVEVLPDLAGIERVVVGRRV